MIERIPVFLILWSDFRFTKRDIIHLRYVFQLSDNVTILDWHVVSLIEALRIVLRWLPYLFRHGDVIPKSSTSAHSSENLANAANAIHNKGGVADISWGAIDNIVRAYHVMDENQRVF